MGAYPAEYGNTFDFTGIRYVFPDVWYVLYDYNVASSIDVHTYSYTCICGSKIFVNVLGRSSIWLGAKPAVDVKNFQLTFRLVEVQQS